MRADPEIRPLRSGSRASIDKSQLQTPDLRTARMEASDVNPRILVSKESCPGISFIKPAPTPATPAQTRAELLRLSGSGYFKVRHDLCQLPRNEDPRQGVLGMMVSQRSGGRCSSTSCSSQRGHGFAISVARWRPQCGRAHSPRRRDDAGHLLTSQGSAPGLVDARGLG